MLVFAYGSLLWNPGFPFSEAAPALVHGWQRRWCVRSTVHRGTPETPGLVLGLVPGGACVGIAYRVLEGCEAEASSYLDRREMSEAGYRTQEVEISLADRAETAICYVADSPCEFGEEEILAAARKANGESGPNLDYILKAVEATRAIPVPQGWPSPCPGLPEGLATCLISIAKASLGGGLAESL